MNRNPISRPFIPGNSKIHEIEKEKGKKKTLKLKPDVRKAKRVIRKEKKKEKSSIKFNLISLIQKSLSSDLFQVPFSCLQLMFNHSVKAFKCDVRLENSDELHSCKWNKVWKIQIIRAWIGFQNVGAKVKQLMNTDEKYLVTNECIT